MVPPGHRRAAPIMAGRSASHEGGRQWLTECAVGHARRLEDETGRERNELASFDQRRTADYSSVVSRCRPGEVGVVEPDRSRQEAQP